MISEEGSDKVTAGSKSSINTTSLADWRPSSCLTRAMAAGPAGSHSTDVDLEFLDVSLTCPGSVRMAQEAAPHPHPTSLRGGAGASSFLENHGLAESARVWQGPPPAACGSGNFYFPGNLGVSAKSLQMSLPPAPFLPLSPLFALLSHSLPASSLLISLNRAPSRPVPSTGSAKLETQLMTPCSPHLALPTGEYTC